MKKTCNGCRALASYGCDLGKETEIVIFGRNGYSSTRKPKEECPKPKTYSQFLYLRKIK